ncbi:MAG: lysine exporter LysO family protein [Zetaproteobacteria bacterium]|nr:lysine exporter LysO family protein [Zetaproteobacteria bacterium]
MEQLLLLLCALLLGYGLGNLSFNARILEKPLEYLVMAVIVVMGNNSTATLLQSQNFFSTVPTFCLAVFIFNLLGLWLVFKFVAQPHRGTTERVAPSGLDTKVIFSSIKYLAALLLGLASSFVMHLDSEQCALLVDIMIFVMLFIVGLQLRRQGIGLRQIFLNRLGVLIAVSAMLLTLAAGITAATILNIDPWHGFLVVSGYGWYTLSGLMVTDVLGPELGTTAFLVDFFRELFAIVLIPLLRQLGPGLAVGYSGATALDFCLPVIKLHHGEDAVPIAITSGFLLTLLAPLTILLLR